MKLRVEDLFCSKLKSIIHLHHELVRLGELINIRLKAGRGSFLGLAQDVVVSQRCIHERKRLNLVVLHFENPPMLPWLQEKDCQYSARL